MLPRERVWNTSIMKTVCIIFFHLFLTWSVLGQMVLPLYPGNIPNNKEVSGISDTANTFMVDHTVKRFITRITKPELTLYLPDKKKNSGYAVLICPGGGYHGLAIDHEGHDMAKTLVEAGIAGIVLKYRCPKPEYVVNKEIVPLQDAQQAMLLLRTRAKEWGIRENRIGILGSSAGGHLASTAGTHFLDQKIENLKGLSLRPDFMILNYPVISFADSVTHRGSRNNLVGTPPYDSFDPEKIAYYSNELQVNPTTPRTFISHAEDDKTVPIANTRLFISALEKNHIPVTAVIYEKGGHGFGMINPTSDRDWMKECIQWIKKGGKEKNKKYCSM